MPSYCLLVSVLDVATHGCAEKQHSQSSSEFLVSKAGAVAESELHINAYLAHKVRNLLSAAPTATSFLSRAHKETSPVAGAASAVVFPEQLSVLIVDDSAVLRKLLGRSLKQEEEPSDLIFMDQYTCRAPKNSC